MNIGFGIFSLSIILSRTWAALSARSANASCLVRRCVFYVTGHGFGHAARSVVVIRALLEAGFDVEVVSSVQESFFKQSVPGVVVHHRALDSGAYQSDALNVDALKSLQGYLSTVHSKHDVLLENEIHFLKEAKADIVIADATPIACAAGKLAGAKVVILSNFCWDFIYTEMLSSLNSSEFVDTFEPMINQISSDYSHSDAIILYPGYNEPIGPYRQLRAPLIARVARRNRNETRASLGIGFDQRVLLLGFGGHSTTWKLQDHFLPADWICIVLSSNKIDMPSERFIALQSDVYAPDIVAAADVWIGKLGFGSVSEALAHAVPLIYIPRSSWPEEIYLEQYLATTGAGLRMPEESFFGGSWAEYLDTGFNIKTNLIPYNVHNTPQKIVQLVESIMI